LRGLLVRMGPRNPVSSGVTPRIRTLLVILRDGLRPLNYSTLGRGGSGSLAPGLSVEGARVGAVAAAGRADRLCGQAEAVGRRVVRMRDAGWTGLG
jgi:hypothetical protein